MSYHLCSVPALKKQYNWRDYTNLVIAGFGSKQITPELHELKVGAIVDEKIGPFYEADIHKIRIPQNLMDNGGLDSEGNLYSASAFIIPYAQKEEIQNILNASPAETINRLRIIAHNTYILMRRSKLLYNKVLGKIRILIFID